MNFAVRFTSIAAGTNANPWRRCGGRWATASKRSPARSLSGIGRSDRIEPPCAPPSHDQPRASPRCRRFLRFSARLAHPIDAYAAMAARSSPAASRRRVTTFAPVPSITSSKARPSPLAAPLNERDVAVDVEQVLLLQRWPSVPARCPHLASPALASSIGHRGGAVDARRATPLVLHLCMGPLRSRAKALYRACVAPA